MKPQTFLPVKFKIRYSTSQWPYLILVVTIYMLSDITDSVLYCIPENTNCIESKPTSSDDSVTRRELSHIPREIRPVVRLPG